MKVRRIGRVLWVWAFVVGFLASGRVEGAFYFILDSATVPPSETMEVTFSIQFPVPVRGLEYSLAFDPDVLEAVGKVTVWERPSGLPFESDAVEFDNQKGTIVGSAVISPEAGEIFPVDLRMVLFVFRFRVKAIPASNETGLTFAGPPLPGCNTTVKAICETGELYPGGPGSERFAWGLLGARIVFAPSDAVFIRGDANGDGIIDLTDAISILAHLFQGGKAPACPDAADANDDGQLDLTDAVAILGALFLGAGALPPPTDIPGPDPTADDLRCGSPI